MPDDENMSTRPNAKMEGSNDSGEPIRMLLLSQQHVSLLSAFVTRIASRVIFLGLVVLEISSTPRSLWLFLALVLASALLGGSWLVQEVLSRRDVDQIEELIAQSPRNEDAAPWVQAFIRWRHERWTLERLRTFQVVEPLLWLLVLIIAAVLVPLGSR